MKSERSKALISFCLFLIIITKDLLVSYYHVIPERGKANRVISWFVILPLMIIAVTLSINVLLAILKNKKLASNSKTFSILFSLPSLLYFLYFLVMIIYVFTI